MTIQVSVIVPTCNRLELLNRCLAALVEQTFDPSAYEIIVVDDAASQATQRLVNDWAERAGNVPGTHKGYPALQYIPVTATHGPAAARNLGWRSAIGEIIAFTDDDCIPDRQWLRAGVEKFQPDVIGVSGRLIMPLMTVPTDYERNALALERSAFITANCFYRREAIAQVNGFDQRFTLPWREDSDLLFTLLKQFDIDTRSDDHLSQFPFVPGQGWITESPQDQRVQPTAVFAPLASQFWGEQEPTSPRIGGFRDLAELTSVVHSFKNGCKLVYAPDAIVVHPIRPAAWGVSLKQQRKSFFNALLYKKHPELYRRWLAPVTPWHYYGIVGALSLTLAALLFIGLNPANQVAIGIAILASLIWLILTTRFCLRRLQGTSHNFSHAAEMVVTSVLIPPLSLFWRLLGAISFRVVFF
ncbi:glycosyltransferase family 2 protein [Pantanalinema rosaneae CENA516]|uniref:glycosyltransferase family 2 protein n=1 Tax=Pantanalinema rosaneae TaxID=1620701 RepID=UPI003D6E1550